MNIKTISGILIAFSIAFFAVSYTPLKKQGVETDNFKQGVLGEIRLFTGNIAPRGWEFCHGQPMNIASYGALYSILSTTYGGDAKSTFHLPDFRGRMPIGARQGEDLTERRLGQIGGTEEVVLKTENIPSQKVQATFPVFEYDKSKHTRSYLAKGNTAILSIGNPSNTNIETSPTSLQHSEPINNMQPYNVTNYIICIQGLVPHSN